MDNVFSSRGSIHAPFSLFLVWDNYYITHNQINPLTAGAAYIRVFIFY